MYRRTTLTSAIAAGAAVFALAAPFADARVPASPGASTIGSVTTPPPPPPDPHPVPTAPDEKAVPTPPEPPQPGPQTLAQSGVAPAELAEQIEDRLSGPDAPVGYGYAIMHNGVLVQADGVGDARIAADGQQDFEATTRMEVMSVTKPMGAIALQKLLDQRGISVDTPVGPYLPIVWPKGPGYAPGSADPVTFRHLLTHTSGIRQLVNNPPEGVSFSNTWDGMKKIAQIGTDPGGSPQYKNANYVMIRILIARLAGPGNNGTGPLSFATENLHYKRYLKVLNKHVFSKAGVPEVTCWSDDDDEAAMVYNRDDLSIGGAVIERDGDKRKHCGGHTGLHLSADDLVRVATHLRHTEQILPAPVRDLMFSDLLGWNSGSNSGSNTGFWWHGGDGYFGGGRHVHTCVMALPQNYEAALVINSQYPSGGSQCGKLIAAFKAAD